MLLIALRGWLDVFVSFSFLTPLFAIGPTYNTPAGSHKAAGLVVVAAGNHTEDGRAAEDPVGSHSFGGFLGHCQRVVEVSGLRRTAIRIVSTILLLRWRSISSTIAGSGISRHVYSGGGWLSLGASGREGLSRAEGTRWSVGRVTREVGKVSIALGACGCL